jgi:uncharacterized Fe-S center protein
MADNLTIAEGNGYDNLSMVHGTLITAEGTLDQAGITIHAVNTRIFPAAGSATIRQADGSIQVFQYTGKTASTFTGCTIVAGDFDFYIDDKIQIA